MLKLAPNLVVARIVVNFDEQDWPDPREILDVLCLQSLFVSHMDILQYLKVPALTELACYIDDDDDPDDLLHLDPFVVRSGCTLRRFAFAGSPDAQATGAILRQHPSVTQLAIMVEGHDNSDWPTLHDRANALISHLTIPGDATASAAISPQLSEISFGCKDHCSFDYSLHLQMLQSRWKVEGCTLKRAVLLIQSEPGPNAATVRGLDALREEGLDLFLGEGVEASDIMNDWMFYPRWVNYKY
ncbi:hypothetical protein C8R44DRAFT_796031 [Mycena epipterygia]|nr:hypothetical protein C8R44DRAFT_796031 [Mycena epipterygia]